jgi:hypothetical protein
MPLSKPEVLSRYAEIAMQCWTPDAIKKISSLKDKAYITRSFILKYSLGLSPSLECLHDEGLTDDDLRSVGLLADSGHGPYPFFRDRMIVPFFEGEQVVYLTSRRISDTGSDGTPLPKNLKAMSLPSPPNGVERPDGYGLNLLVNAELLLAAGLWLVEGPMDAAYCDNLGQPAIGFIGGQLESRHGLIKRVRQLVSLGVKVYVALDGTPDVTEERRVLAAAAIHPNCMICQLPEGRDPDTLLLDEISGLKTNSKRAVDVYSEALDRDLAEFARGSKVWSHENRDAILKQWRRQLFKNQIELRLLDRDMRAATAMSGDEYSEHVVKLEADGVKPFVDVPAPPKEAVTGSGDTDKPPEDLSFENPPDNDGGPDVEVIPPEFDSDAGRPVVRNFNIVVEKDDKGKDKNFKVIVLLQDIVRTLKVATGDWPRCASGFLFAHDTKNEKNPIKVFAEPEELFGWMQGVSVLRWDGGSDRKARALVTKNEFFAALKDHVQYYDGIEMCPHEPMLPDVYYAYEPDPDYEPDGRYFKRVIAFFDNVETTTDRELIRALFMTPMAGLQWDKRPAFAITAGERNCGKSTLAEAVGDLYGGHIELRLGRDPEKDIFQRLLATNNLYKRVARIDNVKGLCSSVELEAILTSKVINGHRIHKGDASRPNNLTFIFTGNALTLSSDLTRRTFTINMTKPLESEDWEGEMKQYIIKNRKRIFADIIAELRRPVAKLDLKGGTGGWAGWAKLVLSRLSKPHEILATTRERRVTADEEIDEADAIMDGISEAIDEWNTTGGEGHYLKYGIKATLQGRPSDVVFINSRDMATILNRVLQGSRRMSPPAAGRRMQVHIKAGRLPQVTATHTEKHRGYFIMLPQPLEERKHSGQQMMPWEHEREHDDDSQ